MVKYSVLSSLRLPYYNFVQQSVIDPMHNLFTGTAHKVLATWKGNKILTREHFEDIQTLIDAFCVPRSVGRIPHKISSGFSGFKSDQWRTWTVVYSLVALKPLLPSQHYTMWVKFVEAVYLICRRSVTLDDIEKADELFLSFCEDFEQLFGSQECTINMHLHCHLKDCILDFGPPYAFWVYSFERCNGYLGQYPSNKKSIECQLMSHFQKEQQLCNHNLPPALRDIISVRHAQWDEHTHAEESWLLPPYRQIPISTGQQQMIHQAIFQAETMPIIHVDRLCVSAQKCRHLGSIVYSGNAYLPSYKQMLCVSVPELEGLQIALVKDIYQVSYSTASGKHSSNMLLHVCLLKEHKYKDYYSGCVQLWSTDIAQKCYVPLAHII